MIPHSLDLFILFIVLKPKLFWITVIYNFYEDIYFLSNPFFSYSLFILLLPSFSYSISPFFPLVKFVLFM